MSGNATSGFHLGIVSTEDTLGTCWLDRVIRERPSAVAGSEDGTGGGPGGPGECRPTASTGVVVARIPDATEARATQNLTQVLSLKGINVVVREASGA